MSRELVGRVMAGDHEAFEVLAKAASNRLFAVAMLILRDVSLAEDAVQEALFDAWREAPRLRDPDRWDAWLRRLLVNACADEGRRRRRLSVEIGIVHLEPAADDGTASLADRDQLERGFRRLGPEQRAAIVLRFYLGLTVPEVADAMGVPLGTAKSRLHYATDSLRAALEAESRTVGPMADGRVA